MMRTSNVQKGDDLAYKDLPLEYYVRTQFLTKGYFDTREVSNYDGAHRRTQIPPVTLLGRTDLLGTYPKSPVLGAFSNFMILQWLSTLPGTPEEYEPMPVSPFTLDSFRFLRAWADRAVEFELEVSIETSNDHRMAQI